MKLTFPARPGGSAWRIVVALGAVATLSAEPASPAAITFDDGRGTVEVIERLRFEDRANNFDFDSAAHSATDDSWFVQRLRLGLNWKADTGWSLQVQLQDARELGSERPKVPFILGAEGNDALDLRMELGQDVVIAEADVVRVEDATNLGRDGRPLPPSKAARPPRTMIAVRFEAISAGAQDRIVGHIFSLQRMRKV